MDYLSSFLSTTYNAVNNVRYSGIASVQNNVMIFNNSLDRDIDGLTFPYNIHTVELGANFSQRLYYFRFPDKLNTVKIYSNGVDLDRIIFPSSLNTIKFTGSFNKKLDNIIFSGTIQNMCLGFSFNQPLDTVRLPYKLHTLQIGYDFNQKFDSVKFPDTFHTLDMRYANPKYISNVFIPSMVKKVVVPMDYKGDIKLHDSCILTKGMYHNDPLQ